MKTIEKIKILKKLYTEAIENDKHDEIINNIKIYGIEAPDWRWLIKYPEYLLKDIYNKIKYDFEYETE